MKIGTDLKYTITNKISKIPLLKNLFKAEDQNAVLLTYHVKPTDLFNMVDYYSCVIICCRTIAKSLYIYYRNKGI